MSKYIKTENPEKFVKLTLDYTKGYRRDNSDRGYRVYVAHVHCTKDGYESHTLFKDSQTFSVLMGIPRRSTKTDNSAKLAWQLVEEQRLKEFCEPRGITLIRE